MKTRAAVHLNYGEPMILDEIDLPNPGPSQVIVRQYASGVCHSQLHQLHNPDLRRPLVIGHESTGVVVAKGDAVTHVKEGDKVLITWVRRALVDGLSPPAPTMLTLHGVPVSLGVGGTTGVFTWAESTIADEQFIVKLPDGVATDVTAVIGCAVMTGCGAVLNSAAVRPNDSVAVIGVGGVGLCIVQAAANVGASTRSSPSTSKTRSWNSPSSLGQRLASMPPKKMPSPVSRRSPAAALTSLSMPLAWRERLSKSWPLCGRA